MNFVATDEQEELRQVVRAFLATASPVSEARRLMEGADTYDPATWRLMADELGLLGLVVPEPLGGAGLSQVELAIVMEEMGAVLLRAPYFSTVALAANALLCSGDEQACADFLPAIAAGRTVATLAVCEDGGSWDEGGVGLAAAPAPGVPGGWLLDGHKSFVTDGAVAELLLVAARSPAGTSLFAVPGDADGLHRQPLSVMDLTRPLARLEMAGTPARLVGREGGGWSVVDQALALATVALAAEQVGGAQRCLDMTVAYARTRAQFGRPIGSFQAVKHACADALVAIESARSAVLYASWAGSQPADEAELAVAASTARVAACAAYERAAAGNVHFHGALGFTWEHDAHLYFKRARTSSLLLGSPAHHRKLLADRLGL